MTTVNFYCINDSIQDFLYNLLYQLVIQNNKRILLYSNSFEKLEKLNDFLWQAGKDTDFLPHSLITDPIIDDRLILSNKLENKYKQNYIFLSDFVDNKDFLNSFEKIFYISKKIDNVKKISDEFLKLGFSVIFNVKTDKWLQFDSTSINNAKL